MPRGRNDIKVMEFTDSGICKNALSNDIEHKDAADQLNEAFGGDIVECKEVKESMTVDKGSKLGTIANAVHEHALRPVITGATFGATSYGVGSLINEEKARSERKKVRDRALQLARRDIEFELAHPRSTDGKFRSKPEVKPKKISKGYMGTIGNKVDDLGGKLADTIRRRMGPKPPPKPKTPPTKARTALKKTALYGGLVGGGAAANETLSGRARRKIMPRDPNNPFD